MNHIACLWFIFTLVHESLTCKAQVILKEERYSYLMNQTLFVNLHNIPEWHNQYKGTLKVF